MGTELKGGRRMTSKERAEAEGQRLETDGIKSILPSPEAMMVQRWFSDLDDIAVDFTERLIGGDEKEKEEVFSREFDGTVYSWSWIEKQGISETHVQTYVRLQFTPDRLLRGSDVLIIGGSGASIVDPITDELGFTSRGPSLLLDLGIHKMDVPSIKREEVLERIRDYLPEARSRSQFIALNLPKRAKEAAIKAMQQHR